MIIKPAASDNPCHYYPSATTPTPARSAISACSSCCGNFIVFLIFFLAILILAILLTSFLYIIPMEPEFDLQRVGVQYMNISPSTPTSAAVSFNISMSFNATNDYKYGIKYDESKFNVTYHNVELKSTGTLVGFDIPPHSAKQIQTVIGVDKVSLMHDDAANLVRDASSHDRVELRVVDDIRFRIQIMGFNSPSLLETVNCTIAISPRRKALTSKQCSSNIWLFFLKKYLVA